MLAADRESVDAQAAAAVLAEVVILIRTALTKKR
jgi:hypothetical protein